MAKYRERLPQLGGALFLTDGGIETTLIFHEGFELPCFAAFDLFKHDAGRAALDKYFRAHAAIARQNGVGFILESATWRASADWGEKLGYSASGLAAANRQAIVMLHELRGEFENDSTPMVISGCIGPRGDGYNPASFMSPAEAERYHRAQAEIFRDSDADMTTAITITYAEEAIGIARAAQAAALPVAIAFTVETDGRLPSGQEVRAAIEQVDDATGGAPLYYMISCAHPRHFAGALAGGGAWLSRIHGLRANASTKSHRELDESTSLDAGDPADLAARYRALRNLLPNLNVFGGCCGTDHRHIEAICRAVLEKV